MTFRETRDRPGFAPALIVTVLAAGLMLLGRCDSPVVTDIDPLDERVYAIQSWYERALASRSSSGSDPATSKIGEDSLTAAVLDAMVRQYPPDWSQVRIWANSSGGSYAAAPLGTDQPSVSRSHHDITVVRTLVVELDAAHTVRGGRLLEFVSPDPLNPRRFPVYVRRWLSDDWRGKDMLTVEYSIGYRVRSAAVHARSDSAAVAPVLSLKEVSLPGKAMAGTWWCWISDLHDTEICFPESGPDGNEYWHCGDQIYIYLTCTYIEDGDDDGDDGDDGVYDPPGGGGGGGDPPDDTEPDCTCSEESQCDLAEEYEDDVNWPCSKFFVHPWHSVGTQGTHGGQHGGYGYTTSDLINGYSTVVNEFTDYHVPGGGFTISSVWRCPHGNSVVGGAQRSKHLEGIAIDFTGYYDPGNGTRVVWPIGDTQFKTDMGEWAIDNAGAGYFDAYDTTTHLHLDWR